MVYFIKKKHPGFDENTLVNDIAILKLTENVELNRNIQIACLPDPKLLNYPTFVDVDAWVVGWGTLSYHGSLPDSLNNVKIRLYDNEKCSNVFAQYAISYDSQLCAGGFILI